MSMKHIPTLLLGLFPLLSALPTAAEVRIEPLTDLWLSPEPALATPASGLVATALGSPTRAAQATTDALLLPYFEVDPHDPAGVTTLFAVRNETADPVAVRVMFLSPIGPDQQVVEEIALPGHAVQTFNLRNVRGLHADDDGIARGLVVLGVIGGGPQRDLLTGDFFLLRGTTATGGPLLNLSVNDPDNELCRRWSARFLNGGTFDGETTLTVVADVAQGLDAGDPPTLVATVYAESGAEVARFAVKSDSNAFQLELRELVPTELPFGSLTIDFPQTQGAVLVEHRAHGGYRVGLKGGCVGGE
jgi:hypothetical protein